MLTYIGFVFITLGMVSFIISAIGLLRMPDIYTRMHVGAKSPTVATLLVMTGALFLEPSWSPKLLLLASLILLTNPLSSSVIARASHTVKLKYLNPHDIDELEDSKKEQK